MAKTSQLLAEDGLAHACAAIRRAIDERIEDPLRGCEDWAEEMVTATTSIMVNVVASPRFRVYDVAHFGWGSPENVGLVSVNHEGEFVLSLVLRRSCKVNMEVFVMEFGTN